MKIITCFFIVGLFTFSVNAQNDSLKLIIPELPIELKHDKAIRSHVFNIYIAIVKGRTNGESPYDIGKFYGNSLGLTWAPIKEKGLIYYAEWLTAYITLFKNYNLDILYNSKETLEFRMKNIGEEYIDYWSKKYKSEDWITHEEYFDYFRGFFISTSNYLGFEAESAVNEGWLQLKIY